MKLFLRRNAPLFYALGAMLALYIPWLNRGYTNLEYVFPMAARGLSDITNSDLINAYWDVQANPLGYSLILASIFRAIGYHEWFWLTRVPAIFGAIFIILSGFMLLRAQNLPGRRHFYLWSLLFVCSPMIIAYSTSATADILPVGLLMLSIAFVLKSIKVNRFEQVFSSILFGLAIITKYNAVYFGLFFVVLIFLSARNTKNPVKLWLTEVSIFLSPPAVIVGVYVWWSSSRFDVFISNRLDQTRPNFTNLVDWVQTLGKYLSFLGLFCCVIPIFAAVRLGGVSKFKPKHMFVLAVLTLTGWLLSKPLPVGEMDFGQGFPLGVRFVRFLETFGFINGVAIFQIGWYRIRASNRLTQVLMAGLAPYLILTSASRPSQRYLIFVLPIVFLILVEALDELPKRTKYLAIGSTALGFAAVSLLGMSYLTSQGNASEEMAVWVEENSLISRTSAGAIRPHAGQHWWGVAPDETRYEIIAVKPSAEAQVKERILHREPMKVLGKVTRVYLLREIPVSP